MFSDLRAVHARRYRDWFQARPSEAAVVEIGVEKNRRDYTRVCYRLQAVMGRISRVVLGILAMKMRV